MSDNAVTSGLLLETLRAETGRPDLEFESAPLPLSGGFYAEMLRFGLVDPPDGLAGDLVARIVPDAGAGVWEATVQRYVAAQGFPTPAVRMTVGAGSALGRYLVVMDHVDGHPPMAGLGIGDVTLGLPRLVHELPRRLARIAACLHALDPGPLAAALAAFNPRTERRRQGSSTPRSTSRSPAAGTTSPVPVSASSRPSPPSERRWSSTVTCTRSTCWSDATRRGSSTGPSPVSATPRSPSRSPS